MATEAETVNAKELAAHLEYYIGKTVAQISVSDEDGRHVRLMFDDGTYVGIPDLPRGHNSPHVELGISKTALLLRFNLV